MSLRVLVLFALAAMMGAAVAVLPALAAPSEAKLEVNENCVENEWPCWAAPGSGAKPKPASKLTIAAGGEVSFTDNANTKANIAWLGAAPVCTPSVPVSPTPPQAPWEGKCKFEQPGTYRFESVTLFNAGPGVDYTKYEIVVEGAVPGTTTTTPNTPTTTTPTTPNEASNGSPLVGGSKALALAHSQRGSTVHGSIEVSQAGSGGRLEVGLFLAGAQGKTGHPHQVRVGRLVRSPVKAGRVSFSVPLTSRGRASLRRHRRLALTVKVTLTPAHGEPATVVRGVVAHA